VIKGYVYGMLKKINNKIIKLPQLWKYYITVLQ